MTARRLARTLARAALRLCSRRRGAWGEAMQAEVEHIGDDLAAAWFAAGCLWTAALERLDPMTILVAVGRWGVGAVTVAYALLFAYGAVFAAAVLAGGRDAHIARLTVNGFRPEGAQAVWEQMLPGAVFNLAIAVAYLAAAFFLVRWRAKAFVASCGAILGVSILMPIGGAFGDLNSSLAGALYFLVPLAMLAGAAFTFAKLDRPKSLTAAA